METKTGMSITNKIVRDKIRDHVIEHFEDVDYHGISHDDTQAKLKKTMENLMYNGRGIHEASKEYVEGGSLLISNYDILQFLDSLGLKTKIYEENPFDYYLYHVSKIMIRMYRNQL